MKFHYKKLYFWVVFCLFALTGCSQLTKDPNQKFFAEFKNIQFDDPNISVNILTLDTRISDPNIVILDYLILNKTGKQLVFSVIANPQAFIFDAKNDTWHLLENRVGYYNFVSQDCSPIKDVSDIGICQFGVDTKLNAEDFPATLRIVTIGDVMENGEPTGEKIGVFFDVEIPGETSK